MRLDGIHHITCITENGPANVDFYVRTMGLRLVKKTINFDVPNAYHLYYGSEFGTPGSILTFFEYPDIGRGRAGAGMIHRIGWRVSGEAALDFWDRRLTSRDITTERHDDGLRFEDPEGLGLELVIDKSGEKELDAETDDISPENRLGGFEGVRAYTKNPETSEELFLKTLGFEPQDQNSYRIAGDARSSTYSLDPRDEDGFQGAGTVHHIAWASAPEDHLEWRKRVVESDTDVTEVIDRKYFRSIYFNEPSGVLFEIATTEPGFSVDEPPDRLGDKISLPNWHEHRRSQLEKDLTPILNPRYEKSEQ
ncbi:MAG: VOC family protein [Actinomycetota bacterium]|nr:VOC family protein [Actinomycetota bacterium]